MRGFACGAGARWIVVSSWVAATLCSAPRAGESFVFESLAEGVHLVRPAHATESRTNSLVVEREDGLLVAASQPSPAAARELLAAIEARLGRPLRYLALPHSHADAAGGASAFPESMLVIGTSGYLEALRDPEYDFGAETRIRSLASPAWSEPPRRLPTLVLEAKTLLDDPKNPVELLPFGRVHSRGDMLLILPRSGIFFGGALLAPGRDPYAGDAQIASWMAALNHLVREAPRVLIPLRGASVDLETLRAQRDGFAWLQGQVNSGLSDRLSHDAILSSILEHAGLSERFASDSPFLIGLIERAIEEAAATRAKFHRP